MTASAAPTPPAKAPYGSACNHCGECCRKTLCDLADMVFGTQTPAPCPALEMDREGRSSCGLTTHPTRYVEPRPGASPAQMAEAASFLIGTGLGCDFQMDGEAENLLHHRVVRRRQHANLRDPEGAVFARLYRLSGKLREGRQRSASIGWFRMLRRFRPRMRTHDWFR